MGEATSAFYAHGLRHHPSTPIHVLCQKSIVDLLISFFRLGDQ
jgi:hypothetical protein